MMTKNVRSAVLKSPVSGAGKPHPTIDQHCQQLGQNALSLAKKLTRKRAHINVKRINSDEQAFPDEVTSEKTEIKSEPVDHHQVNQLEGKAIDDHQPEWMPPVWKQQLDHIYEMRKSWDAPVDSMGCDVISDEKASPEVKQDNLLL